MKEIGEILKQARIEKGYTLDDLQQITKIQKRYLEAIENGNTEILPGRFYARAFVRQYADIVGLNGEELLDENLEVSSKEINEEFAESMSSSPTRQKVEKKNVLATVKEQLPTILIFVLVAAILIIIYFAFRQTGVDENQDSSLISDEQNQELVTSDTDEEESAEEKTEEEVPEEEVPEEESSEEDAEEIKQEFNLSNSTADRTVYEVTAPHPEEQSITLKTADGESWVSIQVDGETVESTTLATESSVTTDFTAETKEITLRIGNANATSITVNGTELDYGENAQGTVQNMLLNFIEE
ncbi:MAG: DUF4115 domain-containing protein [Atopostipes suicloacalis]|nr:DUF4115 domain-containing protein [Atopostipes suicloacalis]